MADLVIPEDFCHNDVKPVGKTSHSDGENKHFIWSASFSRTPFCMPAYNGQSNTYKGSKT